MAEAQQTEEEIQETVPGYSGHPEEGQGPAVPPEGVTPEHEDAVVSFIGVTEPTKVFAGDGVTPIEDWPPDMHGPGEEGRAMKDGAHPQTEADLKNAPEGSVISPAGVTPPTLVYQGDGVTLEGEEKAEAKSTKEDSGGDTLGEQTNYEEYTVAELKEMAAYRGVEIKHDWTKSEIIKALKKADKAEGK